MFVTQVFLLQLIVAFSFISGMVIPEETQVSSPNVSVLHSSKEGELVSPQTLHNDGSSDAYNCRAIVCRVQNHHQFSRCSSPSSECADFCDAVSELLAADEMCFETFHHCSENEDKFWMPTKMAISSSFKSVCQGSC